MTMRICLSIALMAAGSALSGCIDYECPAEFARPLERERFCGHTGNTAAPAVYKPYVSPYGQPPVVTKPVTAVVEPAPTVQAAPQAPIQVQPVPPPNSVPPATDPAAPGQPLQIRP